VEQAEDMTKERKQDYTEHQSQLRTLREEVAALSLKQEELKETLRAANLGHSKLETELMQRITDVTADYEKRLAEVHQVTCLLPLYARMIYAHLHARTGRGRAPCHT
jgi:predicted nuclease with TOPRIM domain